MGKIIISENVSLDGVVEDPTGELGFRHGGWFNELADEDRVAWAQAEMEEALGADALLLGRRTDEYFAERWVSRTGPWADRLNELPKYVVSSTVEEPQWTNSTVLKGDVASEVAKLKEQVDGEIVVYGSNQLVRLLLEHDLVDEARLMIYPCLLGEGERVFDAMSDSKRMRLLDTQIVGDNLAFVRYEFVKAA
jgi:dihydrofolate reductase